LLPPGCWHCSAAPRERRTPCPHRPRFRLLIGLTKRPPRAPRRRSNWTRLTHSAPERLVGALPVSAETSEPVELSFDECLRNGRLRISVCKHNFEPRDPEWAAETEQRILDFVADTPLLRISDDSGLQLHCRSTFCRVYLDVDRAALTDRLRSIAQYDEDAATEHEFAYLTLSNRWANDRAEELRLALVLSDLLAKDGDVEVSVHQTIYREEDSVLEFELFRCAKRDEFCSALR
jgi:hypothetical protein